MKNYFFISGMARSGTTLLDKLLNMQPKYTTYSQPFPYLFRYIKQTFFKKINYPKTYYVLNDLFKEKRYNKEDFVSYLDNMKIKESALKNILHAMSEFSGQYTKINEIDKLIDGFSDNNLFQTLKFLLNRIENNTSSMFIGFKEVQCEEFLDYFINNKIKGIVIVRDPRDVITSINTGFGYQFTGKTRPLLFHLRNWRKSVDMAISLLDNTNFLLIKYEDLIFDTHKTLFKVCSFIDEGMTNKIKINSPILDADGQTWKGNSSAGNTFQREKGLIDKMGVGRFKLYLNEQTIEYIEKFCYPEMKFLDYGFINSFSKLKKLQFYNFKEQFDIKVDDLPIGFSANKLNLKYENERIKPFFEDQSLLEFNKIKAFSKDYYIRENVLEQLIKKHRNVDV